MRQKLPLCPDCDYSTPEGAVRHKSYFRGKNHAEIRPFAGLRYNQSAVKDISKFICPPYDVIPPVHADLHSRSPYISSAWKTPNIPGDSLSTTNTPAPGQLSPTGWIRKSCAGTGPRRLSRRALFQPQPARPACAAASSPAVRLEEWEKGIIRPHEKDFAAAKEGPAEPAENPESEHQPGFDDVSGPDRVIADTLRRGNAKGTGH